MIKILFVTLCYNFFLCCSFPANVDYHLVALIKFYLVLFYLINLGIVSRISISRESYNSRLQSETFPSTQLLEENSPAT